MITSNKKTKKLNVIYVMGIAWDGWQLGVL